MKTLTETETARREALEPAVLDAQQALLSALPADIEVLTVKPSRLRLGDVIIGTVDYAGRMTPAATHPTVIETRRVDAEDWDMWQIRSTGRGGWGLPIHEHDYQRVIRVNA